MQGKLIPTSIFKSPASVNVRVKALNLEGDEQSDLSVLGGVHKAVYAYPSEHEKGSALICITRQRRLAYARLVATRALSPKAR